MRKPSYAVPIAIGAIAIGSLVGMNVLSQKNAPKTAAQLQAEAEEASAAKNPTPDPTVQEASPLSPTSGQDLVLTNGFKESGPKEAEKTVVIGYEWTPDIQANPGKIQEIVKVIEQNAPKAKIILTNVDDNPTVPSGIQVNGKVVAPIGEDGTVPSNEIPAVMQALTAK